MTVRFSAALRRALPFALLALPVAANAAEPACPAERGRYVMTAEEGEFRASFIPALHHASMASDFYLRLDTPQRPYWFSFSISQGYGGISLIPVSDPYADSAREDGPRTLLAMDDDDPHDDARREVLSSLRFILLDDSLAEIPNPPSSGDAAPPYLMLPEIGVTLWYGPRSLTEDETAERDPMPRAVFKLAGCATQEPAKAWP